MKSINLLLLLAVFVAACEKDINIKMAEEKPKLVLHSKSVIGESFELKVGSSLPILKLPDSSMAVKNAKIQLWENGILVDSFEHVEGGHYVTYNNTVPKLDRVYHFVANAPGFPTAKASTSLSSQTATVSSIVHNANQRKINNEQTDEVRMKFSDPPGEQNNYEIRIFRPYLNPDESVSYYPYNCLYTFDVDVLNKENTDPGDTYQYCLNSLYMNDKNFNGQTKELVFYYESYINATSSSGVVYKPKIQFLNISQSLLKYALSYEKWLNSYENPFAEPVQIYSNVEGGHGVVGLSDYVIVPIP